MCTLTWLLNNDGYEVFFNRDEQRGRAKAELPVFNSNSESIFPIDPESKGTWISVNKSGLTLCLLNNYQCTNRIEAGDSFTSRGTLIPELIRYLEHQIVIEHLKKLNLTVFRPFTLCIFPPILNLHDDRVFIFNWDGKALTEDTATQPIISSAVKLHDVVKNRTDFFRQSSIIENADAGLYLKYHSSHQPVKGSLSVCMHRDDARTQSLSYIRVDNTICYSYHDGPPCNNDKWSQSFMPE